MNYHDLDNFTRAYVECALWSSTDNSNAQGGAPLDDNYDWSGIHPVTQQQMIDDCKAFQETARALLDGCEYNKPRWAKEELAGHDFWLTRNGHGTGFWDRGLGKLGDELTAQAKAFGSVDLYIGDDGKIYG